jgi:tetratricopeptide (TPR) repeat protein
VDEALRAYRQALERNPKWAFPHVNAGIVHRLHGRWLALSGEDPATTIAAAVTELEAGLDMLGPHPAIHAELAQVRLLEAEARADRGQSPLDALAAAGRAIAAILGPDPESAQGLQLDGEVHLARASWARRSGASPEAELERAERSFRQALERNPQLAEADLGLARAAAERAGWEAGTGRASTALVDAGVEHARRGLALNPGLAEAHLALARLHLERARSGAGVGAVAEARSALDDAVRVNPMLASRCARTVTELDRLEAPWR